MNRKRKYHHGQLRDALIDAAALLCAQKGPECVSLREVAKKVSVSHGAPYHHFRSRADLLHAVVMKCHGLLDSEVQAAVKQHLGGRPYDQLAALGRAYIRFASMHPYYFKAMFRGTELLLSNSDDKNPYGRSQLELLVNAVQQCLGEAGEPSDKARELVLVAWSMVHGLASLWTENAFQETFFEKGRVESLADAVIKTIKPIYENDNGVRQKKNA